MAVTPQESTKEFVLSESEDWATHRRIIGTQWGARWQLQKVMVACTVDGDERVAHFLRSIGVDLVTVVTRMDHDKVRAGAAKKQKQHKPSSTDISSSSSRAAVAAVVSRRPVHLSQP